MNELDKLTPDLASDKRLLEQLARLRAEGLPTGMAAGLESRLLEELQRRRPRQGVARFVRETLGSRWEPVLLALLCIFLTWDLLRIIRYLLS